MSNMKIRVAPQHIDEQNIYKIKFIMFIVPEIDFHISSSEDTYYFRYLSWVHFSNQYIHDMGDNILLILDDRYDELIGSIFDDIKSMILRNVLLEKTVEQKQKLIGNWFILPLKKPIPHLNETDIANLYLLYIKIAQLKESKLVLTLDVFEQIIFNNFSAVCSKLNQTESLTTVKNIIEGKRVSVVGLFRRIKNFPIGADYYSESNIDICSEIGEINKDY